MSDAPGTTSTLPRVVFDCNIFVQALINIAGPAGRCVRKATDGAFQLFTSNFILDEVRESHYKIPRKYGVTAEQTRAMAAGIARIAVIVDQVPPVFVYDRDPDDAHYINLAIRTDAKLIVSRDKDLLDLMNPAQATARSFQKRFPLLRIIDPVTLLHELETTR